MANKFDSSRFQAKFENFHVSSLLINTGNVDNVDPRFFGFFSSTNSNFATTNGNNSNDSLLLDTYLNDESLIAGAFYNRQALRDNNNQNSLRLSFISYLNSKFFSSSSSSPLSSINTTSKCESRKEILSEQIMKVSPLPLSYNSYDDLVTLVFQRQQVTI